MKPFACAEFAIPRFKNRMDGGPAHHRIDPPGVGRDPGWRDPQHVLEERTVRTGRPCLKPGGGQAAF